MMFINHIVAAVASVYDTLVKLVALSTPIMAVLSFPLASSIVDSVYAMVDQDDTSRIQFELKKISQRLALLLLPFAFGVFASALLTITHTPRITTSSEGILQKLHLGGMIVFIFLPGAIASFKALLAGQQRAIRLLSSWFAVLWLLLYSLLGLHFFIYLVA
jgi:hypothetical protein